MRRDGIGWVWGVERELDAVVVVAAMPEAAEAYGFPKCFHAGASRGRK
jgi:hypothetical protein